MKDYHENTELSYPKYCDLSNLYLGNVAKAASQ